MNDWQPKPFLPLFAINGQPNPKPNDDFFPWPSMTLDINYTAETIKKAILDSRANACYR